VFSCFFTCAEYETGLFFLCKNVGIFNLLHLKGCIGPSFQLVLFLGVKLLFITFHMAEDFISTKMCLGEKAFVVMFKSVQDTWLFLIVHKSTSLEYTRKPMFLFIVIYCDNP